MRVIVLLMTSSLLVVVGISSGTERDSFFDSSPAPIQSSTPENPSCTKCRRPTQDGSEVLNSSPNVTDLDLDKTELHVPCRSADHRAPTPASPQDASVTVKTIAEDLENDVLTYNYTVSGGRVVGTGANVTWSLARVEPGTYVIVAGVDDGGGFCGKTMSKTVVVTCS